MVHVIGNKEMKWKREKGRRNTRHNSDQELSKTNNRYKSHRSKKPREHGAG